MKKILKGARIIDPYSDIDEILDLLIVEDKIAAVEKNIDISEVEIIDLAGKIVTPGLIDMHVHLREPGYEYKEDIESGTRKCCCWRIYCRGMYAKYKSTY